MNFFSDDVGGRLKRLRVDYLKLSQREMAEKLGFKRTIIPMIESGKQGASKRLLAALEKTFNVNTSWIMTGEGVIFLVGHDAGSVEEVASKYRHRIGKDLSACGHRVLERFSEGENPGRFGYIGLSGTRLRMHAARDTGLAGTNLYKMIEDDTIWAAMGNVTGWELEILREYLEAGEDRKPEQWMECLRLLRWIEEAVDFVAVELKKERRRASA